MSCMIQPMCLAIYRIQRLLFNPLLEALLIGSLFMTIQVDQAGLTIFIFAFIAPSIAPFNVMAQRFNGTSMSVSWFPLTLVEARGILHYRITYRPVNGGGTSSVDVDGNKNFINITDLSPGVDYIVTVLAYNQRDGVELIGPASDPVRVGGGDSETDSGDSPNSIIIVAPAVGAVVVVAIVIVVIVIVIFIYRNNKIKREESPENE